MIFRLILPAFICMLLSLFGCATEVAYPVVHVDESNQAMNDAMETARSTFSKFVENWQTMPNDTVSIKFGIPTDDDSREHIWFEPISITGTEIVGVCGNNPVKVSGLKFGDRRVFKPSEVTDWMIIVGNKCYGGYTIRVLAETEPENAPPFEFADF